MLKILVSSVLLGLNTLSISGLEAAEHDPRRLLQRAAHAARSVKSITYTAEYVSTGAFAAVSPVVSGHVAFAEDEHEHEIGSEWRVPRIAVWGTLIPSGSTEARQFHSTFDGSVISKLNENEKTIHERRLDEGNPNDRGLGPVTAGMGKNSYLLLMLPFLENEPFKDQRGASVIDYEGLAPAGGVLCHVIYTESRPGSRNRPIKQRWFLGVEDDLPRRVESVATHDYTGRMGTHVLTISQLDQSSIPETRFRLLVPEGYKIEQYKPKSVLALLSVGSLAPQWKLPDIQGEELSLADYKGQILILDFWATWCGPCVQALPQLQEISDSFGPKGVSVVAINTWEWEERDPVEYIRRKGYTFTVVTAGDATAKAYHVEALPTTYVVSREGKILYAERGFRQNELRELIEALTQPRER